MRLARMTVISKRRKSKFVALKPSFAPCGKLSLRLYGAHSDCKDSANANQPFVPVYMTFRLVSMVSA